MARTRSRHRPACCAGRTPAAPAVSRPSAARCWTWPTVCAPRQPSRGQLGRPAFHTLVDVRRLAAAGLIETPDASGTAAPTGPAAPAARLRGHRAAVRPDSALLRRLRDALEATL